MLSQEFHLMSRMSRVTSYDQSRLGKQDLLTDTDSIRLSILVRKFLPFATIVSLAIFLSGNPITIVLRSLGM